MARRLAGFTLAELLIALGILGVIATFTIPKILQNQADSKRKAIFKEAISTLETVVYEGYRSGELHEGTSGSYILEHINAIKLCPSHADAEGCWAHDMPTPEQYEPGLVMHSGAVIAPLGNPSGYEHWTSIDWNGVEGPNEEGKDQIRLLICYEPSGKCGASNEVKSGTARPLDGYWPSLDLYDEIFAP